MNACRSFTAALAGLLLVACSADPAEQRETDQMLIGIGQETSDTLVTHLTTLQRDLLRALVSTDTSELGRLLSPRLVIHETGTREAIPISLEGSRPEQITYLQVLSGRLGQRVHADYHTFHVSHDETQATIYAIAQQAAVQTSWSQQGSHWKATRMILMSAEGARRMIGEAQ